MGERRDRRWFLRRAGIAAAAGTSYGALRSTDVSYATRPGPVTALDVTDFGARGDGTTDDRRAIQATLDAAGEAGASVFLPPGDYAVGGELSPRASTLVFGTHVPQYVSSVDPPSGCKLRMRRGFEGRGLIAPGAEARGVTLRGIALVGDGIGTDLHGIRMPNADQVPGAQGWTLEGLSIAGFSGDGIHGRAAVWTVAGCHLHDNGGWGIAASRDNPWTDAYVHDTMVYFNRTGGVLFGGSGVSGLVHFVNCRFERSGGRESDPGRPRNPDAPGVRITSAKRMLFANCSTDANMGNGVEIVATRPGAVEQLSHLYFANCLFGRDGTGDQRSLGRSSGVLVKGFSSSVERDGANEVKFSNCMVGTGKAADDGSGDVLGPRYGVSFDDTLNFQWLGGAVEGVERTFLQGPGRNETPTILSVADGYSVLPLTAPDSPVEGATYVDPRTHRLMVYVNGRWRSAPLT